MPKCKNRLLLIYLMLLCDVLLLGTHGAHAQSRANPQSQESSVPNPSFVIFAHGLWGSMDKLPTNDQKWIEASPYPHYIKHQEASFLSGPEYQGIPQKYLKIGEGGGIGQVGDPPLLDDATRIFLLGQENKYEGRLGKD